MSDRFQQYLDEVRAKIDLVALLKSDGSSFVRKGRAHVCLSPLRKEKTPSFYVYDDNRWHDFGTEEGGDAFTYVMQRDSCDFKTASAWLGEHLGIERYWESSSFPDRDKALAEIAHKIDSIATFKILTDAADWYAHGLPDFAIEIYKTTYGFTDETIEHLRLGWGAPGLYEYLTKELHYGKDACLRTGLFHLAPDGRVFENYLNRLFFPYWSGGQVRYAIGRRVEGKTSDKEWDRGKYKKLPVHNDIHPYVSVHISNDIFFNEDVLRRSPKELVLTEGITDCIALWQHEFDTMSFVTTTFSDGCKPRLAKLLDRIKTTSRIVICNDNDVLKDGKKPGERGAVRSAAFLHSLGYAVFLATIPRPEEQAKIDACEYVRDQGRDAMRKVLDEAKPYLEYLIEMVPSDLEAKALDEALSPIAEAIASLSPIIQESYAKKIAKRFKISVATAVKKITSGKPAAEAQVSQATAPATPSTPPPEDRVRGEVLEELNATGGYYMSRTDRGVLEKISTFALTLKQKVMHEDGRELLRCDIDLETGGKIRDYVFPKSAWKSRRDFFASFPSTRMQWTGDDEELQGVMQLITKAEVSSIEGTSVLGYYKMKRDGSPRWIFPGGCFDEHGIMETPDVFYVPTGSNLAARLDYADITQEDAKDLASKMLPLLFDLNEPEVILPILGWVVASLFRPRLVEELGRFPILMVWGTAGSGKTSLLTHVFWPMVGVSKAIDPYSCTETEFALMRLMSSSSSVFAMIDEFRMGDMGPNRAQRLIRLLRRLYQGETEERGRADLSTTSWLLQTPICLAGEMQPDETAMLERMVSVSPKKTAMSEPTHTEAFQKIRELPIHRIAAHLIPWSMRQDVPRRLTEARIHASRILKQIGYSKIPNRIHDNLLCVAFGLVMFEAWAAELGVETDPLDVETSFKSATGAVLDGGEDGHTRDSFDRFIQSLSGYASAGILREGTHYAIVGGRLCIHLLGCHDLYLAERRRTGREDETHGLRALRRVAAEKMQRDWSYITNVDHRVHMDNGFVRCIEIDQERIPSDLELDRFPSAKDRRWGGNRGDVN